MPLHFILTSNFVNVNTSSQNEFSGWFRDKIGIKPNALEQLIILGDVSPLVSRSAGLIAVEIYFSVMSTYSYISRAKWYWTSIYPVLEWSARLWICFHARWFSLWIVVHSWDPLTWYKISCRYMASIVDSDMAIYCAAVLDNATVRSLLDSLGNAPQH